ncbi:tyrosine-type recombinase/integrase [Pengzhenrongella frigida]|uniref:tyrosine-type recombinase/integrase n=1 Tax=Pengzhenrongella frigida TaxID=1259133 RepID=UPI001F5D8A79|nr:site-specific integrase [Cellulomonas sp. HLT2-17]
MGEESIAAPTTFDTKRDALAWLARRQTALADGMTKTPSQLAARTTFEDYANDWLAHRPLKSSTRVLYRRQLDKELIKTWGDRTLSSIAPADVRDWHALLLPKRPTERAHIYSLLRTILGTAVADDVIPANPCRVRGAGQTRRAKPIKPATLPELTALTAAMPERYRLAILLGAWCQLRFGEASELRRRDIDMKDGVVRVRRGVTWLTGKPVVDTPKTEAGVRDIAIPPHLLPVVKTHMLDHVARGPEALLFPRKPGVNEQTSPSTFTGMFNKAKIEAGRPDLRFHMMRHTGATLAAASGATLAELMARLGHTTPAMALKYQHASADRDRVLARALSDLAMGGVSKT